MVARAREKRGAEAAHQGEGCGEVELRKHAALRREAGGGVIDDGKAEEKDEDGAARARAEDDAVRRCRRGWLGHGSGKARGDGEEYRRGGETARHGDGNEEGELPPNPCGMRAGR